ncbi:MAG: SMI1/KNR4 family protein, partial [Gemmataceae bacterium]
RPVAAALDRFQSQRGLLLPDSYRDFALRFGPGELGGLLRLTAPGYPGDDTLDLAEHDAFMHSGDDGLIQDHGHPELLTSLFYFASTYAGDTLGWDTREFRDSRHHEYDIYLLPRYKDEGISHLATNFVGLIDDLLAGRLLPSLMPDERHAWSVFEPFVVHPDTTGGKS